MNNIRTEDRWTKLEVLLEKTKFVTTNKPRRKKAKPEKVIGEQEEIDRYECTDWLYIYEREREGDMVVQIDIDRYIDE